MRPRRSLALLAVLATTLALAACGSNHAPTGQPDRTEVRTISVEGSDREYRVHIPASLSRDPALVVMMHGGFGSAKQAEDAYGWDSLADSDGFVVAYPDGEGRSWNAGDCCGRGAREDVADVAFITALVGDLQHEFAIDPSRTFATGMSNGALMSYRLACDTTLFAAIAPVAGTIVTTCDHPAPTSILEIHGLDDGSVRMDGEPGGGVATVDGMPVQDVIDLWRGVDGCGDPVITSADPVTTSISACPDGRTVELITIAGAGHQWPGSSARDGADTPSTALDATTTIWAFFEAA
ncbi:MAG: PHB depolymerase family esterase [Pseudolysinimonas sp.]|uniref:extracellular catalytic domain type 1 short-chain-length polyhydroxyalkanoate depolymerase n=1 Tax=Pseudolysinimonas sp. TaxID=2680009 RepID=UPI0032630561